MLKAVAISDSLEANPEIKMLRKYQNEFDVYKLRLNSLDFTRVENISMEEKDWYIQYAHLN